MKNNKNKKVKSMSMDALLNSQQVMNLLNLKSPTTLIKYEREGKIKVFKRFGNRKRYRKQDISKLL
jgi:predicted site-specific integrase-resolvase